MVLTRKMGVYWIEQEFGNKAMEAVHPLAPELAIPEVSLEEIKFQASSNDSAVAGARVSFFKKWTARARELEQQEKELKATMDEFVAKATANKRLLLFEEMLEFYGYPDMGVCDELKQGSTLAGDIDIQMTGMLPCKFLPALCTSEELLHKAALIRKTIMSEDGSSGDAMIDDTAWSNTLEEVDRGWLVGPLSDEQVDEHMPISRRFGSIQKRDKVALIDDFSESGVNGCVGATESPVLHTVDVACSALQLWLDACDTQSSPSGLQIRTYDLTSAYR